MLSHLILSQSSLVREFDYKVYDFIAAMLPVQPKEKSSSHTVLIDIDEKSLKELGQWPWPRVILADLVTKLNNYNPSTIALDIIFPEEDRNSPKNIANFYKKYFHLSGDLISVPKYLQDNDKIFAASLKSSGSILGVYLTNTKNKAQCHLQSDLTTTGFSLKSFSSALCNTPILEKNAASFGFINSFEDSDGILRRMPLLATYKNITIPSFALAILQNIDTDIKFEKRHISLLEHSIALSQESSFLLSFYPQSWYKKISVVDFLHQRFDPKLLEGKILIIGSSAIGLHDQLIISGGEKISGAEVHITMLDNLLYNHIIIQPKFAKHFNIILSTLFILFLLYLLITDRDLTMIITLITGLGLYSLATLYFYMHHIYISSGYFYLLLMINFTFISIAFFIVDSYRKRLSTENLNRSHVALLDSMVHVAEVHDVETGAHIVRTKKYIQLLAKHIHSQKNHPYHKHLSEEIIEVMYRTAPLHDIGKVGIPDSVLKKPGKLTTLEFEVMKSHPNLGRLIIENAIKSYEENDFFTMAVNIAYTHHEKWDGSGYPEGLKAEEIPLEGRFMAIADVYDAVINKRVYKRKFSYEEAYAIIKEGRGTHFDPYLVDAFFEIKEEFKKISEKYSDDKEESQ